MSQLPRLLPVGVVLVLLGACAKSDPPPRSMLASTAPAAPAAPVIDEADGTTIAAAPADAVPLPPGEVVAASTMPEINLGSDVTLPDPLAIKAIPAIDERRAAGTEIGYILLDLRSGRALAEMNPDLPLIPASTAKIATAIVALDALGPEHRYRTDLLATGPIEGTTLRGDLVLRGDGDPSLDVADLLDLVVQLRLAGVERVDGRFLIDDGALPRLREIEPDQPLEAAYNPSIGALSLAFNRVRLAWLGGSGATSMTIPPLEEARFELASPSLLPPGGIELKAIEPETVVWRVADRRGRSIASLPVKDPGLHTGNVFRWLAA
ncbi:MAG: D-alanyl-D-alanine carboxypeptidase, partial [Geminicoccaceae bacterium]|nr:D-alanyl-D-alanine carboxypeptidase [Geminicoccaceae bacterium]